MPRKMRRAALCSALSAKADAGDIVLLDQISMDAPKTKTVATLVRTLTNGDSALLLLPERNETVEKSARNLQNVKALRANYLNIRDLLGYSKIVMPLAAIDVVSGFLETDEGGNWVLVDEGPAADGTVEA
jgi:large subunit ribosomal protein L4